MRTRRLSETVAPRSSAWSSTRQRVSRLAWRTGPSGAVSPQMARNGANVPEYAESLEHARGPGALERLIVQLEKGADQMTGHARTLFER